MATHGAHRLGAVLLLMAGLIPAVSHASVGQQVGDLWEVTSQMSMPGMPMRMPAQTAQYCAARQWTRPPTADRDSCTTADFAIDPNNPNRVTWTVQCTGDQAMTGQGEVTREGDEYTGEIKFLAEGMTMTIALEGHRISECSNPQ